VAKAEASLALAKAERTRLLNAHRPETRAVYEAEVNAANIRVEQAKKTFWRANHLLQSKAISEQAFEDCETEFLRAEAELRLAESKAAEINAAAREDEIRIADAKIALEQARLADARTMLAKTELKAPMDGVILQVRVEPGELVGAQTKEPIVSMVDVSQYRVRAFVEELDAVRISRGMPARISADGLADNTFTGQIISCSPFMLPKNHFSNRPGERVDVKVREVYIELDTDQGALDRLVVGLPVDVYVEPHVPVSNQAVH
jgi:multidrug resistance efflux pump